VVGSRPRTSVRCCRHLCSMSRMQAPRNELCNSVCSRFLSIRWRKKLVSAGIPYYERDGAIGCIRDRCSVSGSLLGPFALTNGNQTPSIMVMAMYANHPLTEHRVSNASQGQIWRAADSQSQPSV
jgi:hypothetical protein